MNIQTLIIGGGVVGLAIAVKLADSGHEVVVLEKNVRLGEETSSRNSGVIHAGIYYPTNSLKAKLCVRGNELLYDYAKTRKIAYQNTGKLIVSSKKEDLDKLKTLFKKGKANRVKGLSLLKKEQILEMEPDLNCEHAIFSATTGIIDAAELIFALETDLLNNGGIISLNSEVIKIDTDGPKKEVYVQADQNFKVSATNIINSAGHTAVSLAHKINGLSKKHIPKAFLAKGHYYQLLGKHNFQHLIYPLPNKYGLGIHLGLGIDGKAKFGPDLTWVDELNYSFNESLHQKFVESIKTYWPGLKETKLVPDYTGIRPKINGPNDENADFIIQTEEIHGIKGLINLFGIESPGLTSSLAIGETIRSIL